MASTIGIKIANGEFYSLVEEDSTVKKRLVLTTVHNKQRSVQIDLYRSFMNTMADAQYIGSLVVENIQPKPKGGPSIEMIIASNAEGEITAEAVDLDASEEGQRQSLNVSLKSLNEDGRDFELPDFDLESREEGPPPGLYGKTKRFPRLILILAILLALIGGGVAAWFFVFDGRVPAGLPSFSDLKALADRVIPKSAPAVPAAPARPVEPAQPVAPALPVEPARPVEPAVPVAPAQPVEPARPVVPVEPVPIAPPPRVIQAPPAPQPELPVSRTRRSPPVASYKVPAMIPREGLAYQIRWGDTLWDISEAFYRNPWLYPRIARFNNIRNPDFIIAGRTIRIPPRN
jgi:hypothetical protein